MTGLKNLEMEFWNETYEDVVEEELLRGLSSVKVSKGGNFVVRVPWKEGNPIPKVERMSFVGVRLERRAFGVEPVSLGISPRLLLSRNLTYGEEIGTDFSRPLTEPLPTRTPPE